MNPIARTSLLCACVLLHTVSSMPNIQNEWQIWKQKYGKTYSTDAEEKIHLEIWKENYKYVSKHNAKTNKDFEVEMNSFADQEFTRPHIDIAIHEFKDEIEMDRLSLNCVPTSWDWRTKGAVGPVQNQGSHRGGGQSTVAAECVQSYAAIKTGQLVGVSAMEVRDCCMRSQWINHRIFQCIHDIGGLCSTAEYPTSTGTCKNNTCSPVARINGGMMVPTGDETFMMAAVYRMPVMAFVDASHPSFIFYKGGIYSESKCSSKLSTHVLQVVGYGSINGADYWICRNSWGTKWGEAGYVNIARNKNNMCGIATYSIYPV